MKIRYYGKFSESEAWNNHEDEETVKPVTHKIATGKPVASSNSENSGNPEAEGKKWPHNLHMSPAVVSHMDTDCAIVRKIYDREPTDNMEDLDVNAAIWRHISEYHSSSNSSSWSRLCEEFTICQKSSLEACETVVRRN